MNILDLLEQLDRSATPEWDDVDSATCCGFVDFQVFSRGEWIDATDYDYALILKMRNALPEILAVLKSANNLDGHESLCSYWNSTTGSRSTCSCGYRELRRTLQVLDEKGETLL